MRTMRSRERADAFGHHRSLSDLTIMTSLKDSREDARFFLRT